MHTYINTHIQTYTHTHTYIHNIHNTYLQNVVRSSLFIDVTPVEFISWKVQS